ncbi:hypothetical protein IP81_04925 [Novosphingobium sp. AAP83]|uniref:helix-turn-helix domain-containing protein n=1 Tax=Novosphingobium sp. AAP83 TaxID=1523425 RepID=UPI0006B924C2|nr:helix-turn-helix domain-containing protein [Novosphingobium sp. AAP83]KPF92933.1 hypothetical protein IP81_04925 [Novosphingobium sp. AAP83]
MDAAGAQFLSTRSLKTQYRLKFWNEITGTAYHGTRIFSDVEDFNADLWRWNLRDLVLIRPRSPRARIERLPPTLGSSECKLVLHIQHRGRTQIDQLERHALLEPGDMEFNIGDSKYCLDVSDSNDILSVELPLQPLRVRIPDIEDLACRTFSGRASAVRLLHNYILSLWQIGRSGQVGAAWCDGAVAAFYALLESAIFTAGAEDKEDMLLKKLRSIADTRFTDPDLTTSSLAHAAGVTPRSVQSSFARLNCTPSGYIADARLQQAAEWLRIDTERSITDIAISAGFNDIAYFSRCFRKRFGLSAREWRKA